MDVILTNPHERLFTRGLAHAVDALAPLKPEHRDVDPADQAERLTRHLQDAA